MLLDWCRIKKEIAMSSSRLAWRSPLSDHTRVCGSRSFLSNGLVRSTGADLVCGAKHERLGARSTWPASRCSSSSGQDGGSHSGRGVDAGHRSRGAWRDQCRCHQSDGPAGPVEQGSRRLDRGQEIPVRGAGLADAEARQGRRERHSGSLGAGKDRDPVPDECCRAPSVQGSRRDREPGKGTAEPEKNTTTP